MVNNLGVTTPFSTSTKQWFPIPETVAGTFTSTGTLLKEGNATVNIRQDIQLGDWLLNPANDEIRKVVNISFEQSTINGSTANKSISLESAFTTPITNATLTRVRGGQLKKLEYVFAGANAGTARTAYSVSAAGSLNIKYEAEAEGGIIPMLLTPGATSTVNGIYKQ